MDYKFKKSLAVELLWGYDSEVFNPQVKKKSERI